MKSNQMKPGNKMVAALVAALAMIPALAQAHHLPGEARGFTSGMSHPLHGLDHILAMVAVGLWATQLGKRALWAVPTAFVALMTLGGALGMTGMHVPLVETGIALSILVLGLMITTAARLPLFGSMMLVGFFAMFHGFAHGAEMPANASSLGYCAGFAFSTALLHLGGIALGLAAGKLATTPIIRYAGAAIAVAGALIWIS